MNDRISVLDIESVNKPPNERFWDKKAIEILTNNDNISPVKWNTDPVDLGKALDFAELKME